MRNGGCQPQVSEPLPVFENRADSLTSSSSFLNSSSCVDLHSNKPAATNSNSSGQLPRNLDSLNNVYDVQNPKRADNTTTINNQSLLRLTSTALHSVTAGYSLVEEPSSISSHDILSIEEHDRKVLDNCSVLEIRFGETTNNNNLTEDQSALSSLAAAEEEVSPPSASISKSPVTAVPSSVGGCPSSPSTADTVFEKHNNNNATSVSSVRMESTTPKCVQTSSYSLSAAGSGASLAALLGVGKRLGAKAPSPSHGPLKPAMDKQWSQVVKSPVAISNTSSASAIAGVAEASSRPPIGNESPSSSPGAQKETSATKGFKELLNSSVVPPPGGGGGKEKRSSLLSVNEPTLTEAAAVIRREKTKKGDEQQPPSSSTSLAIPSGNSTLLSLQDKSSSGISGGPDASSLIQMPIVLLSNPGMESLSVSPNVPAMLYKPNGRSAAIPTLAPLSKHAPPPPPPPEPSVPNQPVQGQDSESRQVEAPCSTVSPATESQLPVFQSADLGSTLDVQVPPVEMPPSESNNHGGRMSSLGNRGPPSPSDRESPGKQQGAARIRKAAPIPAGRDACSAAGESNVVLNREEIIPPLGRVAFPRNNKKMETSRPYHAGGMGNRPAVETYKPQHRCIENPQVRNRDGQVQQQSSAYSRTMNMILMDSNVSWRSKKWKTDSATSTSARMNNQQHSAAIDDFSRSSSVIAGKNGIPDSMNCDDDDVDMMDIMANSTRRVNPHHISRNNNPPPNPSNEMVTNYNSWAPHHDNVNNNSIGQQQQQQHQSHSLSSSSSVDWMSETLIHLVNQDDHHPSPHTSNVQQNVINSTTVSKPQGGSYNHHASNNRSNGLRSSSSTCSSSSTSASNWLNSQMMFPKIEDFVSITPEGSGGGMCPPAVKPNWHQSQLNRNSHKQVPPGCGSNILAPTQQIHPGLAKVLELSRRARNTNSGTSPPVVVVVAPPNQPIVTHSPKDEDDHLFDECDESISDSREWSISESITADFGRTTIPHGGASRRTNNNNSMAHDTLSQLNVVEHQPRPQQQQQQASNDTRAPHHHQSNVMVASKSTGPQTGGPPSNNRVSFPPTGSTNNNQWRSRKSNTSTNQRSPALSSHSEASKSSSFSNNNNVPVSPSNNMRRYGLSKNNNNNGLRNNNSKQQPPSAAPQQQQSSQGKQSTTNNRNRSNKQQHPSANYSNHHHHHNSSISNNNNSFLSGSSSCQSQNDRINVIATAIAYTRKQNNNLFGNC